MYRMLKAATSKYNAAYLDDQYNNRLRVPDFMTQHVQPWQYTSQQVRAKQAAVLDVAYGPGAAEKCDIFPAGPVGGAGGADSKDVKGSKGQPVLVFIHGGYWRSLDKADHSFVAPAFTQLGVCVVVPNYALCSAQGSTTVQDITLQMVRAVAWVHDHIAQYGGDPARITVAGHSAGGHLAAMLAACEWERWDASLPRHVVRNALSISGLHDLDPIMHCPYLQADLQLTSVQVQQCSPAYFAQPRAPLFAVCGADESDEFLRQNSLIETAWGARYVPACEAMAGQNHFSMLETLLDPHHRTHQLACRLLGV
jgi:arylformamidase